MRPIYTIGYQSGISVTELEQAVRGQDALIVDTRYSPRSRLPAWNIHKLEGVLGRHYIHLPSLGNINYKNGGEIVIADPANGIPQVVAWMQDRDVVLMCACWDVHTCHRSVVAQLVKDVCGCDIIHLTKPQLQAWADKVTPTPAPAPAEEAAAKVQLGLFGDQKVIREKKNKPVQTSMFDATELMEGACDPHPSMDFVVKLALEIQDPRTPEQKEADTLRDAQDLTKPML